MLHAQQIVNKRLHPQKTVQPIETCSTGNVWVKGHWSWNDADSTYEWTDGKCIKIKRGHYYIQGFWKRVDTGWIWEPGKWVKIRS